MYKDKKTAVIIAAAGSGSRMGSSIPKQFLSIGGEPILLRTARTFSRNKYVDGFFVVTGADYLEETEKLLGGLKGFLGCIAGGKQRQDSVYGGLEALDRDYELVLIQDGVRPYVTDELIERVLEKTLETGACVPAVPVKDTIKVADSSLMVQETPDRSSLWAVQTPQGFSRELLLQAYEAAFSKGYTGTDDGSLVEAMGKPVAIVQGLYENIKITTKEDMPVESRIGSGYDVHRLVEGRNLILCGVEIPHVKGLLGHSDADVALHALMDAILGAAALGDIGRHFPDTDERYKGISSMKLLAHVRTLVENRGFVLGNADITIIAQAPKLAGYIDEMRENIARVLETDVSNVNVKATTTEKLGFSGREEGIAASAVCMLKSGII